MGAGVCLKKKMPSKINASLRHIAEDFILETLFFHPKDRTIKGISREEISSFLCLRNFSVVYCNWNSLLSINHIKGKGLGDISSLHVLA